MTTLRRLVVTTTLAALVGSAACGRGDQFGRGEVVELLVLDGLERSVAECIVAEVDDELELGEVIGLTGELDREELGILYEATSRCRPVSGGAGSGVTGGSDADLDDLENIDAAIDIDVESVVAELLLAGVEPELAVCAVSALLQAPDAGAAVLDEDRRAEAVRTCEAVRG